MVETVRPAEHLVALAGLAAPDYREGFRVAVAQARTAEGWARTTLEDAPAPMRAAMTQGWSRALGFDLGPPGSPDHVHGWRILHREPEALVTSVESGFGVVRIVVAPSGGSGSGDSAPRHLDWVMVIAFGGTAGRATWAALAPAHRAFVRRLLTLAARPAEE